VALEDQTGSVEWSNPAARVRAAIQQLSPSMAMSVTSQPTVTTVTHSQTEVQQDPTEEAIIRLQGLFTKTEEEQADEESAMKTFKAKQLDKIEELKDKNSSLRRRSLSLCASVVFATRPLCTQSTRASQRLSVPRNLPCIAICPRDRAGLFASGMRACDENSSGSGGSSRRLVPADRPGSQAPSAFLERTACLACRVSRA
jgi:hypothetical protein